jgi:hypothetical protein
METLSSISWLWRAFRGRSVTFAALFAVTLLGVSVIASVRHVLTWMNAPWLAVFLLPILLIAILARKESDWIPDPELRSRWARWLILGSIVAAMVATVVLPKPPPPEPDPNPPPATKIRRHGHPAR